MSILMADSFHHWDNSLGYHGFWGIAFSPTSMANTGGFGGGGYVYFDGTSGTHYMAVDGSRHSTAPGWWLSSFYYWAGDGASWPDADVQIWAQGQTGGPVSDNFLFLTTGTSGKLRLWQFISSPVMLAETTGAVLSGVLKPDHIECKLTVEATGVNGSIEILVNGTSVLSLTGLPLGTEGVRHTIEIGPHRHFGVGTSNAKMYVSDPALYISEFDPGPHISYLGPTVVPPVRGTSDAQHQFVPTVGGSNVAIIGTVLSNITTTGSHDNVYTDPNATDIFNRVPLHFISGTVRAAGFQLFGMQDDTSPLRTLELGWDDGSGFVADTSVSLTLSNGIAGRWVIRSNTPSTYLGSPYTLSMVNRGKPGYTINDGFNAPHRGHVAHAAWFFVVSNFVRSSGMVQVQMIG